MKEHTILDRAGYFSSSSIHKLIPLGTRPMTEEELIEYKKANPKSQKKNIEAGFSASGLTYIDQKKREIKLGRQMNQEKNPRSASWGNFCENIVFNKIGLEYKRTEKGDRKYHPTIKHWNGEEDFTRDKYVGDFKCFELDNFTYTHDEASKGWESFKVACPDIAWQLVSGAVLCKKPKAELILYVPYKKDLHFIIETAKCSEENRYKWLAFIENMDELPYLFEGKHYKDISSFCFDIPKEDKEFLTQRVIEAEKLLLQI